MIISFDKQPKCAASLKAEISADEVKTERKEVTKEFAKNVKIPGFRPGKTPTSVIEKRHGDAIKNEVETRLIRKALSEAVQEQKDVNVLNVQDVKLNNEENGSFTLEADLVLAPDVPTPDYSVLTVDIPKVEVTDEMIDDTLSNLQQRFADYEDVEGRAIEKGDLVVVDYTSTVDGKPMDEVAGENAKPLAQNEGYWIKVEEEAFFPGFTDGLLGLSPDEKKDITVQLPSDFPLEVIREKEAVFSVTVKEIKKEVLPELNDDLAKKIDPEQDLEGLKELIRADLENQQKRNQQNAKMNGVMDALVSSADFELNEGMVQRETQSNIDQFTQQSIAQGTNPEELEEKKDEIFARASDQAEKNLRGQFLLQKVAEEEKLEVGQEELLQHMSYLAQQEKTPVKKFIKQARKDGKIENIHHNILMSKAVDFLVSKASFNEIDAVEENSDEDNGE